MDIGDFIRRLRAMHEKWKLKTLVGAEIAEYKKLRDSFNASFAAAQGLAHPGAQGRRTYRVAVMIPIEISVLGRKLRAATIDLSPGGFSAVIDPPPRVGTEVAYVLEYGRDGRALEGKGKVTAASDPSVGARVSVAFAAIPPAELEPFESFLLDCALARLPG